MQQEVMIPTTAELLDASNATPEFKTALLDFAASQKAGDRVRFPHGNPPVKVLRAISGLLEHAPTLEIDLVDVKGFSGCSDYRGEIIVNGGRQRFRFVWDCAWKAREVGYKDYFGDPDQIRAARTFGYRCFQTFEQV